MSDEKPKTKVTVRRRTVDEKKVSASSSAALGLREKLEETSPEASHRLSYLDHVVAATKTTQDVKI